MKEENKNLQRPAQKNFRLIYESAPFGIFHSTPEGKILDVNPAFVRILGYDSPEDIIETVNSSNLAEALYAEPNGHRELVKNVLEGRWEVFENRYKRKDGSIIAAKLSLHLFVDPITGERGLEGFVEDVTECKRTQDKLVRTVHLNQILLDNMPCVALLLEPHTRIIAASNEAGIKVGAMPGKTCYETWANRNTPCPWCMAGELWASGKMQHCQPEYNGTYYDAYWVPISDDLYMHYAFDITESKIAAQKLQEREERYRSVVDNIGIGVTVISPKMEILTINNQMKTWFPDLDISNRPICYKSLNDPQMNAPCSYCPTVLTLSDGQVHETETDSSDGDKGINWRIISSPIRNEEGKIIAAIEMVEDITIRKEMERKAIQYQKELAHASRVSTIGEMASSLAHELNQPFCAILAHAEGCIGMLNGQAENRLKLVAKMETIAKQAEHAGRIINLTKDFIKKEPHQFSDININKIVHDVVEFIAMEAKRLDVKVHMNLSSTVPLIRGNAVQIEQVLLNLVRNGLEAMEDSHNSKRLLIISTSLKPDNGIEVTIEDHGKGIRSETVNRIFESFFTTKPYGLGIGLSISRSIIESHGGKIYLMSNSEKGATFGFTLPVTTTTEE